MRVGYLAAVVTEDRGPGGSLAPVVTEDRGSGGSLAAVVTEDRGPRGSLAAVVTEDNGLGGSGAGVPRRWTVGADGGIPIVLDSILNVIVWVSLGLLVIGSGWSMEDE